jgi:hypothetical protein
MEFQLSWSLPQTFLSHDGISAITKPFTNFSFTRWNFGCHGALQKLFFHTMEFRLSRSPPYSKVIVKKVNVFVLKTTYRLVVRVFCIFTECKLTKRNAEK